VAGAEIVAPNSLVTETKHPWWNFFFGVPQVCSHKWSQAKKKVMSHVSSLICLWQSRWVGAFDGDGGIQRQQQWTTMRYWQGSGGWERMMQMQQSNQSNGSSRIGWQQWVLTIDGGYGQWRSMVATMEDSFIGYG
jgi:hypothetical protein